MTFRRRSFPGLEIAFLDCTGRSFAKHAHDEFVIGANFSGRERIWLDRRTHEAATAEVTLYNPGQVQASSAGDASWSFTSVYLDPSAMVRLAGLPSEVVFERPILWNEGLARRLRSLGLRALDRVVGDAEVLEGAIDLVAELLDAAGSKPPERAERAEPEVRRVAERLRDEMAAPPCLDDLATDVGLTPVQLVRAFTRSRGLPPFAWLMVERLKTAREAVSRGERLSGVAAELGFADQAHLTRRFKAMYGVPPGVWAKGVG
ncbi:helix-turn-helix domain-containing protein [Azospirillum canadense]|uniref:helix-turn-helix domain-containing protein n=1 Tax=Azospirillum canadense TaxID=403962 RepID=UPI0022271CBF|nr:AraC family transcriptional regulator [Azospirillum canadense]MCW2240686.1 AraC family chemosensory pili system transcriptional regulator ChpD [Azospirillum canadense]